MYPECTQNVPRMYPECTVYMDYSTSYTQNVPRMYPKCTHNVLPLLSTMALDPSAVECCSFHELSNHSTSVQPSIGHPIIIDVVYNVYSNSELGN